MAEPTHGRVLIVDDEEMVTRNLAMLLRLESALVPLPFNAPSEALEFVRGESVDVVLADFIMPGMNGLDLLAEVRRVQPAASRILLTGYADKQSAIRAINEVGLFQYLEKPWDNALMLMVLRNATERSQLLRQLGDKTRSLNDMREQIWRILV
jgi:DNA-binding NtrC family response regulator